MNFKLELERAYRCIRGFYTAFREGEIPDKNLIAYHSPTIGAALRFVGEGELDGSEYFDGKSVNVLIEVLKDTPRMHRDTLMRLAEEEEEEEKKNIKGTSF